MHTSFKFAKRTKKTHLKNILLETFLKVSKPQNRYILTTCAFSKLSPKQAQKLEKRVQIKFAKCSGVEWKKLCPIGLKLQHVTFDSGLVTAFLMQREENNFRLSRRFNIADVISRTECALQWRHNGHDSVSNHQPDDCLLNRLFRRRSKKISKLRVTGLCAGNSPETGEFPA